MNKCDPLGDVFGSGTVQQSCFA